MSYSPQQSRRPAPPAPGQLIAPQSRAPVPTQRGGYRPQTTATAPQRGGIPPISSTYTHAPTLGQFWRSDVRRTRAGRTRWPGLLAFLGGLAALILLIAALAVTSVVIASVALAFSVVAGFFALVAIIAGLGRGLGVLGLLLALAGNVYLVAPFLGRG
ncbi:hypothetical protein [Pseudolysinimonas sp.]|uniref:hypothetical protein n=1 Tax=Pseudolysinimonas sp. TaxID=2680009 RepID=UPI003F7D56C3